MKIFKIIFGLIFIALLGTGVVLYKTYKSGNLQATILEKLTNQALPLSSGDTNLWQEVLGLKQPRTFLVLFLNNTEQRPGGGFIGAYAVVKMSKGQPQILKVEGTEILDNNSPVESGLTPPAPLKEYLQIKEWKFRDSNWSPDFSLACRQGLELYKRENGVSADEIAGVIGFTPTLVEELLRITGPIKINNEEYTADNFTSKVEYEVEYGFEDKGLDFSNRKSLLTDLTHVMSTKLLETVWSNWSKYFGLAEKMIAEKQLMFYSPDSTWQKIITTKGWGGQMRTATGDYFLWADANLGALKTDASIRRTLSYSLTATGTGKYLATAKMTYNHIGKFDWRTSRYRTYARIFVPVGSKLLTATGMMETDRATKVGRVDQGQENGKQWFGAFIAVEPGRTGELSFTYLLPENINQSIQSGNYNLLAQKQLGATNTKLTVNFNFDKKITTVLPANNSCRTKNCAWEMNFITDQDFKIQLEK